MVKRKVNAAVNAEATIIPVAKKVSPPQGKYYTLPSNGKQQLKPSLPPPPSLDTFISVEQVPPIVAHPQEEVYVHNRAVIRRRIEQRKKNKICELKSTATTAHSLGTPCKKANTNYSAAQHDADAMTAESTNSNAINDDTYDFALNSETLQSYQFQSVQLAIEDLNRLVRHVYTDGVPATDTYQGKSPTTMVTTTTGERRPLNSILCVDDIVGAVEELQTVVARFIHDFYTC